MPKFRKKPIVIEAEQFFRDKHFDGKHVLIEGVETRIKPDLILIPVGEVPNSVNSRREFFIRTLEGDLIVSEGDWIITGVAGERYPCKPDIFEATYEPVTE